jgi:hypothetical protein
MALKDQNTRTMLGTGIFIVLLVSLLVSPFPALAMGNNTSLPNFADFSKTVQNGQSDELRGIYVPDVLALPIIQQPAGNAGFVSNNDGEATQFSMASRSGNIGLLAHNHLAGKTFPGLAIGQEIRLVYGTGRVEYFVIKEVLKYQALQPSSPYSSFRDLNNKDEVLSARQMFKRVYLGDRHVTLQTCIAADGDPSWGRLFIVAVPKPEVSTSNR